MMNIDINLAAQEEGKHKTFFLVVGVLGVLVTIVSFLVPSLHLNNFYFVWLVTIPGFIEAILYGLGKKRMFAGKLPYLKIDDLKIESSKGGVFAKPQILYWADMKTVELKLFEIQLTTTDSYIHKIDLLGLTDDNLKNVKTFVSSMKSTLKV